ncbi:hypothetical protein [Sansalvadorimonas verongulae]|uniref:hypothetical protein n=1 Tax=Sansalvadorimonas verongulae TaxID=2172824 RepID=UPI0012BD6344|nr:hypothetical protein [Sansalvadorimonas verongulae]MTI12041.1 hypothetical protein [Sansalvadorimonas verongulae]
MPITPFSPGRTTVEEDYDKAFNKLQKWLEKTTPEYLNSPEYKALSKANKMQQGGWFSFFMEMNLGYFSGKLADLEVGDVQEIMEELIPRKMICPDSSAKTIVPELIAYWSFLLRECGNKKLKNAVFIIAYLESIKKNYLSIYRCDVRPSFESLADFDSPDNLNFITWVDEMIEQLLDDYTTKQVLTIPAPWSEILCAPSNVAELVQHMCLNPVNTDCPERVEVIEYIFSYAFQNLFMGVRNKEADALEVLDILETNIPLAHESGELIPKSAALVFRALVPFRMYLSQEFMAFVQQWQMDDIGVAPADTPDNGEPPSPDQLKALFVKLIEETPDEFAAMQGMQPMLGMMPARALGMIFHILAEMNDTRLGDVLALYVLDPDDDVALAAISSMRQFPGCVSGVSLNRFIRMRNWLSGKVQEALDSLVRDVRKRGVIPQSTNISSQVKDIWMPPLDGMGSQGVMVQYREGILERLSGCVFKEDIGIVDALLSPPLFKSEGRTQISMIRKTAGRLEKISPDIVRALVLNYLALHAKSGLHLDFELVRLLEVLGMENWNPEKQNLEQLLPAELLAEPDASEIEAVQKSSLRWHKTGTGQSWFVTDDGLEEILELVPARQQEAAVCDQILKGQRTLWQERLLRLALWAHHGITSKGPNKKLNVLARDFLVVRHLLGTSMPTSEIAFMKGIARLSLKVLKESREEFVFG